MSKAIVLGALVSMFLAGPVAAQAPEPRVHREFALGEKIPRGWDKVGKVEGLLSEDWWTKKTGNTISFAREVDLPYVNEVVDGLEQSYSANRAFLGITPPQLPLEFYFCSMDQDASHQPKFHRWLGRANRFSGVALNGTKMCCVNLGNSRASRPYAPWEMAETARHEMNHLFAFQLGGRDRKNSWGWLYEALAHTIENTSKSSSAQLNPALIKSFMKGYRAVDASWAVLIRERDNQEQEQYRDYDKLLVSIIYFLQDSYGQNCIAKLMSNCRGKDLEDALVQTFGKGAAELETAWKNYYGIR